MHARLDLAKALFGAQHAVGEQEQGEVVFLTKLIDQAHVVQERLTVS